MTYVLYKMSAPGWKLEFDTEEQARDELLKHICDQCRTTMRITEGSSIDEMLGTDCGCEFDVDVNA